MNKHISSFGTITKRSLIVNKVTKDFNLTGPISFKNWRIWLKLYSRIFPSFNRDIRSPDAFKPIWRKQKYLMDYKVNYWPRGFFHKFHIPHQRLISTLHFHNISNITLHKLSYRLCNFSFNKVTLPYQLHHFELS